MQKEARKCSRHLSRSSPTAHGEDHGGAGCPCAAHWVIFTGLVDKKIKGTHSISALQVAVQACIVNISNDMKILAADYITEFNPCMHIFRQIACKNRGPVMNSDLKCFIVQMVKPQLRNVTSIFTITCPLK